MKAYLIAAILALFCISASADDGLRFVANVTSYHFSQYREYMNTDNRGLGVEYASGDMLGMIGEYRNSNKQHSDYALAAYTPWHFGPVSIGGAIGGVNGYSGVNAGGWFPAAAGLIRAEFGKLGANLLIMPKTKDSPYTLGLQAKYAY